jgi:hypothetical protein
LSKGGAPDMVGSALSLLLRLRNRNSGASHTQSTKNVAISANPCAGAAACTGRPYARCARWRASCAALAKWKNQRKWSATTSAQLAANGALASGTAGQRAPKFWR